jgi:hypothetical protein
MTSTFIPATKTAQTTPGPEPEIVLDSVMMFPDTAFDLELSPAQQVPEAPIENLIPEEPTAPDVPEAPGTVHDMFLPNTAFDLELSADTAEPQEPIEMLVPEEPLDGAALEDRKAQR